MSLCLTLDIIIYRLCSIPANKLFTWPNTGIKSWSLFPSTSVEIAIWVVCWCPTPHSCKAPKLRICSITETMNMASSAYILCVCCWQKYSLGPNWDWQRWVINCCIGGILYTTAVIFVSNKLFICYWWARVNQHSPVYHEGWKLSLLSSGSLANYGG